MTIVLAAVGGYLVFLVLVVGLGRAAARGDHVVLEPPAENDLSGSASEPSTPVSLTTPRARSARAGQRHRHTGAGAKLTG
jgi:hypothetical protein